jgi:transposase
VRSLAAALARKHLAQPRRRGDREALRVLLATREGAILARTKAIGQLKALIVNAPEQLRLHFRTLTTDEQLSRCARLRTSPAQAVEHRATIIALRSAARRALSLEAEAADLESQLELLVRELAPRLLAEPAVGVISAVQLLNAWSHRGRFRSVAAFASLAGAAPIPASSGQLVRHRLTRGGDRQLNRALHTIVLSRLATTPRRSGTQPDEQPTARRRARSSAASSATSPAGSSASSRRLSTRAEPQTGQSITRGRRSQARKTPPTPSTPTAPHRNEAKSRRQRDLTDIATSPSPPGARSSATRSSPPR